MTPRHCEQLKGAQQSRCPLWMASPGFEARSKLSNVTDAVMIWSFAADFYHYFFWSLSVELGAVDCLVHAQVEFAVRYRQKDMVT